MGILSTINVFCLLVGPSLIIVRGHALTFRAIFLSFIIGLGAHVSSLLFVGTFAMKEVPLSLPVAQACAPMLTAAIVVYFLLDTKARRVVGCGGTSSSSSSSAAAGTIRADSVAVGLFLSGCVLNDVTPAWRSLGDVSFRGDVLEKFVVANISLVCYIAFCRSVSWQQNRFTTVLKRMCFLSVMMSVVVTYFFCDVCESSVVTTLLRKVLFLSDTTAAAERLRSPLGLLFASLVPIATVREVSEGAQQPSVKASFKRE